MDSRAFFLKAIEGRGDCIENVLYDCERCRLLEELKFKSLLEALLVANAVETSEVISYRA